MENPPQPLLPEVMQLIRSPEHFCDGSLTQFIPKFGASAVPYLGELRQLRVVLLNRIGTPARNAAGGVLGQFELEMIEKAGCLPVVNFWLDVHIVQLYQIASSSGNNFRVIRQLENVRNCYLNLHGR